MNDGKNNIIDIPKLIMHPITNTANFIIFDFNVVFSCSIKRTMKYIPENNIVINPK